MSIISGLVAGVAVNSQAFLVILGLGAASALIQIAVLIGIALLAIALVAFVGFGIYKAYKALSGPSKPAHPGSAAKGSKKAAKKPKKRDAAEADLQAAKQLKPLQKTQAKPDSKPILEPIPQEIEDIYYGRRVPLLGPGPKQSPAPAVEIDDEDEAPMERPRSFIYLNKADWTYYYDPEFTMPHHKEYQAEIDRQEHPEMSPTEGLRKFAEQYTKKNHLDLFRT